MRIPVFTPRGTGDADQGKSRVTLHRAGMKPSGRLRRRVFINRGRRRNYKKCHVECPLLGQKRTSRYGRAVSACRHKADIHESDRHPSRQKTPTTSEAGQCRLAGYLIRGQVDRVTDASETQFHFKTCGA